MSKEVIECPMKVVNIFPYGDVLVPDIKKLKEKMATQKTSKEKKE